MYILFNKTLQIAPLLVIACLWGCSVSDESGEENDDAGQGTDSGNTEEDGGLDAGEGDDAGDPQDDAGPEYDPCWSVMDAALPEGIGLNGVWGIGQEDVYAAGGIMEHADGGLKGVIMHFDGITWNMMDIDEDISSLLVIRGTKSNSIYAAGNNGLLLHYNGSNWNTIKTSSENYVLFDIWLADGGLYATGFTPQPEYGDVFYYDNNNWESILHLEGIPLYGIWGSSHNDIYSCGFTTNYASEPTFLMHYDGEQWSSIKLDFGFDDCFDVWGYSPENVYILGGNASEFRIIQFNGQAWEQVFTGETIVNGRITGSNVNDVFCFGQFYDYDNKTLLPALHHFDGNAWSKMNIPETWIIMDIWAASEGEAFGVGYDSEDEKARIFRYSCP